MVELLTEELFRNEILSYRILFDDLAYSICLRNKEKVYLNIYGKSSCRV